MFVTGGGVGVLGLGGVGSALARVGCAAGTTTRSPTAVVTTSSGTVVSSEYPNPSRSYSLLGSAITFRIGSGGSAAAGDTGGLGVRGGAGAAMTDGGGGIGASTSTIGGASTIGGGGIGASTCAAGAGVGVGISTIGAGEGTGASTSTIGT